MLEFIKKIFQNKESEVKNLPEINLQNIEEWVNEKSKPLAEEINQKVKEILMRVDEEIQHAKLSVEVLENAKLQNTNIPFKAKQYMEGNRKAYVRAVNSFLGHLEINNNDYFYLLEFCKYFDKSINDLNKSTYRSYTILQEFFEHETSEIAQKLKNFDNLFLELKKILNNEKIVAINNTKEKINNLKSKIKQKMNMDIEIKGIEANIKLANEEKDVLMIEIEKFNLSEEYKNFLRLNEEKKNKLAVLHTDENNIIQSFSVLERALRKYSHIAFEYEEIILDYLKAPIEALANDKDLQILQILKNLEDLLTKNKLQIDDRKKEKSIEEIKKLSKEFLEHFLKKYFSFKSDMEDTNNKIKALGVPEKLKNFNKQLEEINLRIEKNNEEHNRLKNEVNKITNLIGNLTNEIESDLKKIFDEEVKIMV